MKKNKKKQKVKIERRRVADFRKKIRRKKRKAKIRRGYQQYLKDISELHPKEKIEDSFYTFIQKSRLPKKVEYSELLKYFQTKKETFSNQDLSFSNNNFRIPTKFSLIDNYIETTNFLKKLNLALHKQSFNEIYLDYNSCKQIDVGASICIDIILSQYIEYFNSNKKIGRPVNVKLIKPLNYDNYDIKKVLFSIGCFRNIRGFKINYNNILPFDVLVGNIKSERIMAKREVDITKTVDYIIESLNMINRTLTAEAETNMYKVIGEVIQNAEEHSDVDKRYSIGYFENTKDISKNYGIFNLAILNFGNTIYETFRSLDCKNIEVVKQMEELSEKYTKRSMFKKTEFEEETLWTLYALQDGVSRKADWKRGNGSIRFIESFFKLKGNENNDDISKMVIISGHTRIIFDGVYKIEEKERGTKGEKYKMMTFNDSANIEDLPDKKYVIYEKNYFPGTLISIRLKLDYEITEKYEKENN